MGDAFQNLSRDDEEVRKARIKDNEALLEEVKDSLPSHLLRRSDLKLRQDEWAVTVKNWRDLDHRGGVTQVQKNRIAEFIRQVGLCTGKVAILVNRRPDELGILGAKYEELQFTVSRQSVEGPYQTMVKRNLAELSTDADMKVGMQLEGLEIIEEELKHREDSKTPRRGLSNEPRP